MTYMEKCSAKWTSTLYNIRANHVTSSQSDGSNRVTWLHIKSRRAHFAVRRRQDSSDSRAQEREGHAA